MTNPVSMTLSLDLFAVGYVTEDPAPRYAKLIGGAKSLTELRIYLAEFAGLVTDAIAVASSMTDEDYPEFLRGLKSERRGRFAGDAWAEKYGAILMPEVMFRVSSVAEQFGVPWGCAFIRLREAGRLVVKNGIATWQHA